MSDTNSVASPVTAPSPPLQSTDQGLVAFLLCRGFDPQRVENDAGKVTFYFASSAPLSQGIADFVSNVPVGCKEYYAALRRTRTLISQHLNSIPKGISNGRHQHSRR